MPVLQFAPPGAAIAPLPAGRWFTAEITRIVDSERTTSSGSRYDKLTWKFVIDDPDGDFDGRVLSGDTGAKPVSVPECKLFQWAQEAAGGGLPVECDIDTEDLIGSRVKVRTAHRNYTKGGEEKVWVYAEEVVRAVQP